MGQTLSHGVYLPNEGERNCYAGLASNWQILNTAVGNIAEKAPLVHTHGNITNDGKVGTTANVPLITGTGGAVQAGAFGNQANTFCEGNDSRLSDARTPVAHTHTKSDVTDLLNSNFIPSANNSYDLGSSSYQWKSVYAQSYYYNGTAWGLDRANTWAGDNSYTGIVSLNSSSDVAEQFKQKLPKDVSTSNDAMARVNALVDSAGHYVIAETLGHWASYVAKNITLKYKNDSTKQGAVELRLYSDGSGIFYPQSPFECDLGNSYNKWKTLNGINPGALSLPSSDSADYIDLSSNLSTNAEYQYTAPSDGWLCLYILVNEFYQENAVGLYRSDTSANSHQWAKSVTAAINLYKQNRYQGSVMLPVESGKKYICYLSLNANTTIHNKYLFFYKNKGNV